MSGFYTGTNGACGVDDFEAAGQTGKNPPTICGTNTGYHSETMSIWSVISVAYVVSVCGVRGDLHRHHHPDQHLQERGPHHRQDLQHPPQADFLHSKLEVRLNRA